MSSTYVVQETLSALVYFYLLYGNRTAIPYANKGKIAVTHFGTYVLSERDVNEIRD